MEISALPDGSELDIASESTRIVDLRDVSFAWSKQSPFELMIDAFGVERGERVLLVGPSGSGKSTLLGLLCGSLVPDAGRVTILNEDLGAKSGAARDRFRAEHIGVIFQMFNLLPYLSILDNVLLPLSFAPIRRKRASAQRRPDAEAERLLESLGLDLKALAQSVAELSVGQQQRVAAARALIGTPELVIADEPTSALDRDRQEAFLSLLFAELERGGSTLIMVSHEERFQNRFDRVVQLEDIKRTAPAATDAPPAAQNVTSGARAA